MKRKFWIAGAGLLAIIAAILLIWHCRQQGNEPGTFDSTLPAGGHNTPQTASPEIAIPAERDDVRKIVNPGSASTAERLRQVHMLPDNLSQTDREAVARYLKYGPNRDIELVIKNDLMNKLRNQKVLPPEWTGVLLDLYADRRQNITVRIYALQHLRPQYELTREATIRQAFYEALNETDNEIAGGALLALRYLCTEYPEEFDTVLIARRAAEISQDTTVNVPTRVSAVQVAALLKHAEIEPSMRALALEGSAPLTLRLSAIASLGLLHCPESRPTLEELAHSKGPEGKAARTALKKFQTF